MISRSPCRLSEPEVELDLHDIAQHRGKGAFSVVCAVLLGLTACGGDDDAGTAESPSAGGLGSEVMVLAAALKATEIRSYPA